MNRFLSYFRQNCRCLILIIGIALWCIAFWKAYRFYRSLSMPSTETVLAALASAGINWEAWTLANRTDGDSFSAVLQRLGSTQTIIPYADGMKSSHLWSQNPVTWEAFKAGVEAGQKYWPLLDKADLEEAKAQ